MKYYIRIEHDVTQSEKHMSARQELGKTFLFILDRFNLFWYPQVV